MRSNLDAIQTMSSVALRRVARRSHSVAKQAASNIARALSGDQPSHLALVFPEVNTMGLELLVDPEQKLSTALERCSSGEVSGVIVLENDLYRRAPTAAVDNALLQAHTVVVLDQMHSATTSKATHVFPVTAFSEQESTYVNYESRAQLSFQVHQTVTDAKPGWKWLTNGDSDITLSLIHIRRCRRRGY